MEEKSEHYTRYYAHRLMKATTDHFSFKTQKPKKHSFNDSNQQESKYQVFS
jgi:hypothetical protein